MITARHKNTLEITKDEYVTERGTCIIACSSDKAASDLRGELREVIKDDLTVIIVKIRCRDISDIVLCRGSSNLKLSNNRKIIIRRSRYIDDATLCIESNKGAADLDRRLINMICMGETVEIVICALPLRGII